jgi:hypothetical protein
MSQPEAVKDNPPRAHKTQRPTSFSLKPAAGRARRYPDRTAALGQWGREPVVAGLMTPLATEQKLGDRRWLAHGARINGMVIGGTVVSDCNDEVLGVRVALARRSTKRRTRGFANA